MTGLSALLLPLLVPLCVCYTNTTKFFAGQLNLSSLHFQSYSGYQEIDWFHPKNTTGMFYTLFGALDHNVMDPQEKAPLIVWLQGGPGSGSQFGAFTEVGPVRVENGKVKGFSQPWNILGHLLCVDSPLNAGFSYYGDRTGKQQVSNTYTATSHLLNFLYNFYMEFPSLKNNELYLAGESFAGHYIPNLARKIMANSTFRNATGVKLAGVAIGDGWTDPVNQVNYYDSYLWSVGVVDCKFRDTCTWYQTNCMSYIFDDRLELATRYFNLITDNKTTTEQYMGNISMYNFRNYDGVDRSFVTFLNNNKKQFGVTVDYLSSNPQIYEAFSADISRSYAQDVANLLIDLKVLIYNGQNDVVVNNAGVLQYLNSLTWSGIRKWKNTRKSVWRQYGEVLGWAKVSGNLWYVHVNGAGHMVPTDKPESAFSLMGHFIKGHNQWDE